MLTGALGALALLFAQAASPPLAPSATATAEGEPSYVLGPSAEGALRELAIRLGSLAGRPPGPIRVEGERVELLLGGGPGEPLHTRTIVITHAEVVVPEGLDREAARRLIDEAGLPWKEVQRRDRPLAEADALPPHDATEQARVRARRTWMLGLREGTDAPAPSPPVPCPTCDAPLEGEPERLLRSHRGRPDLLVRAALTALERGRPEEALAWADAASRHERPAADALELWGRLTGADVVIPEEAAPAWLIAAPSLAWAPLALMLAALLLVLGAAWQSRRREAVGLLVLAVCAGALAAARFGSPDAGRYVPPPPIPAPLVAPLAGSACRSEPAVWQSEGLRWYATCEGLPFTFDVVPASSPRSGIRTEHHLIVTRGRDQRAAVDAAENLLRAAMLAAEADGFRIEERRAAASRHVEPLPGSADAAERQIAAALVTAGGIVGLALLLVMLWHLHRRLRKDRRLRLILLGLASLWVALHVLLPDRMVMVYTGYDLTARLLEESGLPRYGAGAVWLYRPMFRLLGADHHSVQVANRVFGVLALVPAAVLAHVLLRGHRLGVAAAIALMVLCPVVWRDHVSEGILAGTSLLVLLALAALALGLEPEEGREAPTTGGAHTGWCWYAAVVAAAAACCRPEAGPALAVGGLGLASSARRLPLGPAIVWGLAVLPHVAWLVGAVETQVATEGIVAPSEALAVRLPRVLLADNLFLEGRWLSPALLVWLGAGVALRRSEDAARGRGWAIGLLMAALIWIAASAVDLPLVSIPRVHLPALLLSLPVAGAGVAALARRPVGRWVNAAVGLAILVGAVASYAPLFETSNADEEELLLRQAAASLPPGEGCFATVGFDDPPPPGHTQRHVPRYLFGGSAVVGLERLGEVWPTCGGQGVVLLGTRCYMAFRQPGEAPPRAPGELEVCRRFREQWELEALTEVEIPNQRTLTFEMYPGAPTLALGVYRVRGPSGSR